MGGCVGDGCSKLPGASILDDPVVRWDPLHCEYCSFPSLEFLANVGGSGTGNPRGEMGVAVCRPLARCTVRIGMSAPPLSPTARLPNSPTTTIRNAAETLEELKGVAQALREGDTAANAVAEALKQGEASKADLLKALRRRNQMRQGVKVPRLTLSSSIFSPFPTVSTSSPPSSLPLIIPPVLPTSERKALRGA